MDSIFKLFVFILSHFEICIENDHTLKNSEIDDIL